MHRTGLREDPLEICILLLTGGGVRGGMSLQASSRGISPKHFILNKATLLSQPAVTKRVGLTCGDVQEKTFINGFCESALHTRKKSL